MDILLETNRLTQSEAHGFDINLSNEQIEKSLRDRKLVNSQDIAKAYSQLYNLPTVALKDLTIPSDVFNLIPQELTSKYQMMAFAKEGVIPGGKIKIAIGNPSHLNQNLEGIIDYFKKTKNVLAELYITTPEEVVGSQNKLHGQNANRPDPVPEQQAEEIKNNDKPVEVKKIQNKEYVDYNPSGIKTVDLKSLKISYEVISKFPLDICNKYNMIVFDNPSPNLIKVAVSDPYNVKVREILDFVKVKNGIAITEFVASPSEIKEAIELYYRKPSFDEKAIENNSNRSQIPPSTATEIPITRLNSNKPQISPPPISAKPVVQNPSPAKPMVPVNVAQPQVATARPVQTPDGQLNIKEKTLEEELKGTEENDLDKYIGREVKDVNALREIAQNGDIPKILAASISLAASKKASDVHIESEEKNIRIRFRMDGVLRDIIKLPVIMGPAIISRIKILSRLKIDEQRVPQDGRFDVISGGHVIDLRVSTLPTVRGEKAAIRLLDKTQNIFNLKDIGLSGRGLDLVEKNIIKPYGVILVTGPTGSGKSTTLYSILQKISNPKINIVTLEDPVEYEIPGINQCQIKPKIGFSFAEGLRSILRQDPNIIMVGEIRDAETAGMATHAALTGHLVLTTLHTNDAAGALPRLINMGIEPFLITSSINVIVAQRLVRKVCQNCKQKIHLPDELMTEINKELEKFKLPKPYEFYEAKGCDQCTLGYIGRIGIYEVLEMTDKIEELAVMKRPSSEIAKQAILEGMTTLKQDGLVKAARGITTVSEVLRVTQAV